MNQNYFLFLDEARSRETWIASLNDLAKENGETPELILRLILFGFVEIPL